MARARSAPPGQLALDFEPGVAAPGEHQAEPQAEALTAEPPVEDQAERLAALDPQRSFIVQAPAGSGKTGLLIQRYLVVLAHARAPEEALAITFTRKAAAEMRGRVVEALEGARRAEPAKTEHDVRTLQLAAEVLARDRSHGWDIEANPGRLQIMTIDALCASLTRRMPLLSGLGAVAAMESDAGELYREAARGTLALLDEPEHTEKVAALLRHLDNQTAAAESMLERLLQRREQWLRTLRGGVSREAVERALVNLARERMGRAAAAVPEMFVPNILEMVRYAARNVAAANPQLSALTECTSLQSLPGDDIDDLPVWRSIVQLLLTGDNAVRRRVDVRVGFPPAGQARGVEREQRLQAIALAQDVLDGLVAHQPFVEALRAIRDLPDPAYDERQWAFIQALGELLPLALAQLKVVFQQHGAVDFVETTLGAIEALGEADAPTDLALALDYRIQHLLIDEFQDTSYSHFELLQRLVAGWEPGDGRTLFLVGDPMQSIYRFREAEVSLFLRVRARGIGGLKPEALRLQVNFRSQSAVVEWVNEVFAQVLPANEDVAAGAVSYAASVARAASVPGAGVEVHPLIGEEERSEPALVLELIRRAQAENPEGTIAVLVRAKAHLAACVPVLKEAGVQFRAIETESLTDRPVVRDLHALARAIVHPADRTAWLTLLRAPWCGLSLRDLEILAGNDPMADAEDNDAFDRTLPQLMHDPARVARMSEDGQRRLARVREALDPVLAARGRGALRRRVEGAWMRLGGPACAQDEVDLDDALVLLRLLDDLERGGDLEDFRTLDERLAALFALPDLHAPDRLQLMTIHKSKGLEFDTVIVAGLGRKGRGDDPQLLNWLERPGPDGEPELLLAAITEQGEDDDPIYKCVQRLHRQRQREEDSRLLYVAVTRARRRAHLIGATELDEEEGNARRPAAAALLERLWPALAPQFDAAARREQQRRERPTPPAPASATRLPSLRRLHEDWRLPDAPASVSWRAPALPESDVGEPEIEFSWAGETARHVGTVVHRFLQQIAQEGLERWGPQRVSAVSTIAETALRAQGVPDAELAAACERVQRALRGVVGDPRARWVLSSTHADAQAELRLTSRLDGELVHVAVDRTFVDEAGTRWIVDYKTGLHEGGDLQGFLDREEERYRQQLERYARVLRNLDGRPVKVALYFPLLPAWREWMPASRAGE